MRFSLGRAVRRVFLLTLLLLVLSPLPAARAAEEKLIAFTFDDGPSSNTPVLLDGLEERGAVATFFMCGVNGSHGVVNHKDLLYRMQALGCQLANHSYSHPNFTRLSGQQMQGEIGAVEDVLYDVVGEKYLELVRIPGGSNSEAIRGSVPHPIIRWSCDPFDWRDRNADIVYNRIMDLAFDGGVILLHDLYITSIQGGLRAMDSLREQGYTLVTVSELFRRRGIYLENGVVYDGAPNEGLTKPAYSAPVLTLSTDTGRAMVQMSSKDLGVDSIHYTTDGTQPTLRSPVYTGPVPVSGTVEFKAAGFDRFATRTPVAEFTASNMTAAPKISGINQGKLSLATETPGATILYTTDGEDPRLFGSEYHGEFTPGAVTKAVAFVPGRARSDVTVITKTDGDGLFYDVSPEAWYYDAVNDMVKQGLMSGVGDYRFDPDEPTTRAALVSILYRLEGSPAGGAHTLYEDVSDTAWYAKAVAWATENGLVNGKSPSVFDPDGILTRQQAAAMLYRYADWSGRQAKEAGSIASFTDVKEAEAYAVPALEWCVGNGLLRELDGGRLGPKDPAMRGQCAAMVQAVCAMKK